MFQALGAFGARLERQGGDLVLVFRFPPGQRPGDGDELRIFSLDQSPELSEQLPDAQAADVVEERLSRHFDVKRTGSAGARGTLCEWGLSDRSASPGLVQPTT